jgi:hypothetical protein
MVPRVDEVVNHDNKRARVPRTHMATSTGPGEGDLDQAGARHHPGIEGHASRATVGFQTAPRGIATPGRRAPYGIRDAPEGKPSAACPPTSAPPT